MTEKSTKRTTPTRVARTRAMLFLEIKPAAIKAELGVSATTIDRQRALLVREKIIGKDARGILSVAQAGLALGLSDRRIRALCAEGRLGQRLGDRAYLIPRDELTAFARRVRPSGGAGVQARAAEMESAETA